MIESTQALHADPPPQGDEGAPSGTASAALAIGLILLAVGTLLLLLFLVAPSADAAGGCGGG